MHAEKSWTSAKIHGWERRGVMVDYITGGLQSGGPSWEWAGGNCSNCLSFSIPPFLFLLEVLELLVAMNICG